MSLSLNAYVSFRDTAREAMDFYQSVLGGELTRMTFGEMGMTDSADLVMHSQLNTPDGFVLMGADTPPGMGGEFTPGNTMNLCLNGDDFDKLSGWFAALSEGGTLVTPLEKQMWGDHYGHVIDRFGVGWMVNIVAAQE
jgi:PhnB protein